MSAPQHKTVSLSRDEMLLEQYLHDIASYPPLSADEERELAKTARRGDKAAQTALVNGTLKFVVSIARQYANAGVSMLDLIAEGNIALLSAAQKYDARGGKRFAAYAVWALRRAMETVVAGAELSLTHPNMDLYGSTSSVDASSVDTLPYAADTLSAGLSLLSLREQAVLRACFGIGQEAQTMSEVAARYAITRYRVRALRKRALRHLAAAIKHLNLSEQ